jgi:hypothetical protein
MTYIFNLTELNNSNVLGNYYFDNLDKLCSAANQLFRCYFTKIDSLYKDSDIIFIDCIGDLLKNNDSEYNDNISVKIAFKDSYSLWVSSYNTCM